MRVAFIFLSHRGTKPERYERGSPSPLLVFLTLSRAYFAMTCMSKHSYSFTQIIFLDGGLKYHDDIANPTITKGTTM